MRFGVTLRSNNSTELLQTALECEKLGYDSIWVADHPYKTGRLECWTALSLLAAKTKKMRLGPLVACNNYRSPTIHACIGASVDMISKGRLEFGIGAGWFKSEYLSVGIPFPKASVRLAQLREGIKIIKMMWTEEKPIYKGQFYKIEEPVCPKPVQKPHPPIMIGTSRGEKILKIVAEYADKWNLCSYSGKRDPPLDFEVDAGSPLALRKKLGILEKYCSQFGRDINDIEKTIMSRMTAIASNQKQLEQEVASFYPPPSGLSITKHTNQAKGKGILGTPEECVKRIREYSDLGVTLIILSGLSRKMEAIRLFAEEVIPNI
jgi:alkanesulfonate monooxygenase SsuD/methylene tetrahydromethanopterin reductase-like flavin-dependent oxidoreductase (luciferase family)